jgi:hypothetical protein
MHPPDELEEYLRGGSALSRQYRKASAPLPPPALERRVLQAAAAPDAAHRDGQGDARDDAPGGARDARAKPTYLAPLALAASVLLSVAVVLAIVFGPQPARTAAQWLADIEALRRAYPDHAGGERKQLP